MYYSNENPDDDPWTEYIPRQQMEPRRLLSPTAIAVVAAFVLLTVLSVASFGYYGLGWFNPNKSPGIAQAPTATSAPTAGPSPTAAPSPTPTPSPTAAPSPAILSVTPNTLYLTNCSLSGRANRICAFTLKNSSSTSSLAWRAKAWNSHNLNATSYLSSTSGTLAKSGKTTVTLFLNGETGVCTLVGTTVYLQFTGPKNTVTVTVTC